MSNSFEPVIAQAMRVQQVLHLQYGGCEHRVEPHALGCRSGVMQLLAYTAAQPGDPWLVFDLERIERLQVLDRSFPRRAPPAGGRGGWERQVAAAS